LVLILRFYWWRINAWSELTATVVPFFIYSYIRRFTLITFPESLFYIVGLTTVAWLLVTFLTSPVDRGHLVRFYGRVQPGGIGWRTVQMDIADVEPDAGFGWLFVDWLCGVLLVYMVLFGVGKVIFGELLLGLGLIFLGVLAGAVICWDLSRRGWEEVTK
jgi:solute:Na+ symporter, SSS family